MSQATPPPVTLCIPVYNEADVIERTLDCVLRQTMPDFKVLISDNHSTDGTYEKILTRVAGDTRFEVFQQERNLGSPDNFKFLTAKVETKYLMYLGSHDLVSDNILEDLLSVVESNRKLIGVVPRIISDEGDKAAIKPQFDSSDIGNPLYRYLIALIGKQYSFHGLYKATPMKETILNMSNFLGFGALAVCRLALLGRLGTSDRSSYHFHNRFTKLSPQQRRQRNMENMQLGSTRFAGTRIVWEFFKLTFTAKLPKNAGFGARLSLLATFPVVLIRYASELRADFGLGRK